MKISDGSVRHWGILIVFLLFIFGMTVLEFLTPVKSFSENENRFLAKKPEFTGKGLLSGQYTKDYETFITDQFPYRDGWIGLKTLSERALLKQEINGVYFGKDGYLIETHPQKEIDPEQAKKNQDRLAAFLKETGRVLGEDRVKAMLVPTANTILTDKLPPFASGFDQTGFLKELGESLAGENLSDTLVNVEEVLKQHKDEDIYFKTDHHWTALGAWYAYTQWCASAGITPYSLDDFRMEEVSKDFYGTVYSKVNTRVEPDTIRIYRPLAEPDYQVDYNMGEKTSDSLYDMEQLTGKDKYAVFLGGNNALVKIRTGLGNGRKLLVVKDSFAHCFVPFAVNHFEEVQMVDLRYFNMPLTMYMEQNGFTDVLVLYNIPNFLADKNMGNMK